MAARYDDGGKYAVDYNVAERPILDAEHYLQDALVQCVNAWLTREEHERHLARMRLAFAVVRKELDEAERLLSAETQKKK